ncbi:DUF2986 domain-containing protein [Aliamphritea ceti]|uniref:DUF2986 domain-containing protein n=1 Tax=Aliamphritea ceti TaxID=1524258 RepID=UPI0021C2D6CD|nr:DUF2986 domain-containing protein [Aliamphritea ceti]
MNRRKKINDTLKRKAKKANAHLKISAKPRYIAKADREKLIENQPDTASKPISDG